MLQRQFSSCDMPIFAERICCGDKFLSPQHVAGNSAGLNSCIMKQDKMTSVFNVALCALLLQTVPSTKHSHATIHFVDLRVHQLGYCPCNMRPMRTHEGACPRFTSPFNDAGPCKGPYQFQAPNKVSLLQGEGDGIFQNIINL